MKKLIVVFILCLYNMPSLYATPIMKLKADSLNLKNCLYTKTDSSMDISLLNKGYFVVKRGKGDGLFYTRFGSFMLDSEGFLLTSNGDFLQRFDVEASDSLAKIQIPTSNIKSCPTSNIQLRLNLDSSEEVNGKQRVTMTIYNSLGAAHYLSTIFTKLEANLWQVEIEVDQQMVASTELQFEYYGDLKLHTKDYDFQWNAPEGLTNIHFDFEGTTQYQYPFGLTYLKQDGHSAGSLAHITINNDGEIDLLYLPMQFTDLTTTYSV